jgi:hypothetical protein
MKRKKNTQNTGLLKVGKIRCWEMDIHWRLVKIPLKYQR